VVLGSGSRGARVWLFGWELDGSWTAERRWPVWCRPWIFYFVWFLILRVLPSDTILILISFFDMLIATHCITPTATGMRLRLATR